MTMVTLEASEGLRRAVQHWTAWRSSTRLRQNNRPMCELLSAWPAPNPTCQWGKTRRPVAQRRWKSADLLPTQRD